MKSKVKDENWEALVRNTITVRKSGEGMKDVRKVIWHVYEHFFRSL